MRFSAKLLFCLCGAFSLPAAAVQLNPHGQGEVLIFPYYTVNNELNTLYSVVNTTDEAKAIKVRFLEGDIGREVLIFNVYLAPFDVWTGALLAVDSTIAGHEGEPSVSHLTADTSCAPYLNRFGLGQEFLPFLLELDGSNDSLRRAREGHLEVIEMGVITEAEVLAALTHSDGLPNDCELFESEWQDDTWDREALAEPSGGLSGKASIINVGEGIAFGFDALALTQFWGGAGIHTSVGDVLPDLSSAQPISTHLSNDDALVVSQWPSGFEAVSAVLMQTEVYNEYAYDQFINGKTEWVMNFPTKKYHTTQALTAIPPFSSGWSGQAACDAYDLEIWDREEQSPIITSCGFACGPRPPDPQFCLTSQVLEFLSPADVALEQSKVLGSFNLLKVVTPATAVTENGWAKVTFASTNAAMVPNSGKVLFGLPVTGFAVNQFTNGGAAEGLLAQYGNLFVHKGKLVEGGEL
ncbi:hypothetical protein [Marinicella meishanensis]|uniref:hypothetical protein n=1 Tax=Marinicella meishanensis TaxID=2873263 RepID=UPI001CBB2B2D|nr:hypothetical protein [Marinicella sp. NBU2979]